MVTVLTRTIGPSGRDYASFTLAEADVTNIGTSADLVANDEAIVFEADAAVYAHPTYFQSSLTTDATRNVTYRAATGSEHGGSSSSGVRLQNTSGNGPIFDDDHTAMEGIVFLPRTGTTGAYGPQIRNAEGNTFRNCISDWRGNQRDGFYIQNGSSSAPTVLENCVCIGDSTFTTRRSLTFVSGSYTSDLHAKIRNCTIINESGLGTTLSGTGDITVEFINCLSIGPNAYSDSASGTTTITGSNCFGDATDPWPAGVQGTPATVTTTTSFSTPLGSGDYAVYMGATGALADVTGNDVWQQGVGPASNSDVPTTDINGVTRSGTSCNPGAFEADGFVAPTVLTRTIGSGKDYSTFTLAEAAVTSIGSGTDLTFYNEAIVFEADAADYSGNFQFFTGGALTCDATRNVTWTHATGAGHGGQFESGANIVGYCIIQEDFAVVDGLSVSPASGAAAQIANGVAGVIFRNLMSYSTNNSAFKLSKGGTSAAPGVVENCVAKSDSSRTLDIRSEGAGVDSHWRFVNCTVFVPTGYFAFNLGLSSSDNLYVDLTNNLALGQRQYIAFSGPTVTLTGSNNFGGATSPFPVAIQGSPYPITATTDTDPGAGDWAIYDATTGALVFDSDNDVLLGGIGPDSDSDVPTTDIVGTERVGTTCDPGAFEVTPKDVLPTGIPSGETFGTLSIDTTITVTVGRGIVSAEAFGTALIAGVDLVVTGIASAEVFGRPALEAGTQFRLEFQRDSTVVDVMTHVDAPLTTLTGQDRPIPGMVHTINYYAQHLGWSSDQTAANDEPSPYGGDKITVIVPPPRGDGATP